MFLRLSHFIASCVSVVETWRTELDDGELIEKIKCNDELSKKAFQILVERHQTWLIRMLKHLVSGAQDAEDLAQNVLVKAYFALPNFRKESSFRTWLRVIATREAFNHFRKKGGDIDDSVDVQVQPADQNMHDERLEAKEAISVALTKVPYAYREILVLRYIEEMEMGQIEETLNLGSSAAKMRLKRAREFFKSIYDFETTL